MLGRRTDPLLCNRFKHSPDKERISAGRRFQRGAEGFVWLEPVSLAREHRDRAPPQRFGANHNRLRIADELCHKRGIVTFALRRPRSRCDQERHSLQPSRQVEKPPQRWSVRPMQIIDQERVGR
jgi:hypothetical protein